MGTNTPELDRLAAEADGWRRAGQLARASQAFEQVLAMDSRHPAALRGRARLSLARGEHNALDWFDRALKVDPGNGDLWLGKAQALDVAGDPRGAAAIAAQLVEQAPAWIEGLRFLAQLRLARGDSDFAGHFAQAIAKAPRDPNIWLDWANQLAATDRFGEAAEVAAGAARTFPKESAFTLIEATNRSAAGQIDEAEFLFAKMRNASADGLRNEARHRIRRKEFSRAATLLEKVIAADQGDIGAWALLGLVWRVTSNPRAEWLHGQEGLYGSFPLVDHADAPGKAIPILNELHGRAAMPIGQSLRGGTQTRGNLFDRLEPEIGLLRQAIEATVESYRKALPGRDAAHPLLSHRDLPWRLAGSWSVRLSGGNDHHKSHIHPSGIVSSALYLEVPREAGSDDPNAGYLELGRPPPDLQLDLKPLAVIEPKPGYLALFPSTLYHGTRPFGSGARLTVAFDVARES